MAGKVKVIVLRTAGTNCDLETVFAFKAFGAEVDNVHINKLLHQEIHLEDYHIMAIPGGFTYGDDIESGRILANEINLHLKKEVAQFIAKKKLIIGICNGFQVLVKAGILPGNDNDDNIQNATLTNNDSGKFEDRWTHLLVEGKGPWFQGLKKVVFFPVAHAEGKFIPKDESVLASIEKNNQIAFRYCDEENTLAGYPNNPNGSIKNIAGITDKTGLILGLMPHPERHFLFTQHPFWTRLEKHETYGDGVKIFENGVVYARENLL